MGRTAMQWEDDARRSLPADVYTYVRQGAHASISADEAVAAWEHLRVWPRVFRDVREVDVSTRFLGAVANSPIGVAPTTLQRAADREGEVAMARGCALAGSPMVLSSNASASWEAVAATGVTWWLQAYLTEDRAQLDPVLDAAVAAGASAIVLTVDTPVVARKHDGGGPSVLTRVPPDWLRANLGDVAEEPKARDLAPVDVERLTARTGLPVVVKGILHPDDAMTARDAGAAAVWVSNHGGRQLDRAVSTAAALPEVAAAVGGAVPVFVDGGVRDPISVLTALALGADGVFLGRLPYYALAAEGSSGVEQLLGDLRIGLEEVFRLAGCAEVATTRQLRVGPA